MSNLENNQPSAASTKSTNSISSDDNRSWRDNSPPNVVGFKPTDEPPLFEFNVHHVFKEVKENLGQDVVEIPFVGCGANHFGMHSVLTDGMDVMIRISRYDVNWTQLYKPTRKDAATRVQEKVDQAAFEAAVYKLLHPTSEIKVSHLLFHRLPVWQVSENRNERPDHLIGRELFVFEKANGDNNVWPDAEENKLKLILTQCASIRAALFSFEVPLDFAKMWLPKCPPSAKVVPSIVAPTRDFAISFLVAKVEEMIKNEGDMIGWESDGNVVSPIALQAKRSLLRLIPLILPLDDGTCYRLVLEHDDFGIHNMTITDEPTVTSLFDWETGHIVPAILSDPRLSVWCDFVVDEDANDKDIIKGMVSRKWEDMDDTDIERYNNYATAYYKIISEKAPEYRNAIKAGRDARHIWFALKAWRGDNPDVYFGQLGAWAERRWQELGGTKLK